MKAKIGHLYLSNLTTHPEELLLTTCSYRFPISSCYLTEEDRIQHPKRPIRPLTKVHLGHQAMCMMLEIYHQLMFMNYTYLNTNQCTQQLMPVLFIETYPAPSHASHKLNHSPTSSQVDKENVSKDITLDEMEQRNEIFRATYYGSQKGRVHGQSKPIYDSPPKHSPPYHYPEDIPQDRLRIQDLRSRSPEHLKNSYRRRYYEYHLDRSKTEVMPVPRLLSTVRRESRQDSRYHSHDHVAYTTENGSRKTSPPIKSIRTVHIPLAAPMETSYPSKLTRPLPHFLSNNSEYDKYNSDFYRKLPPKLHIVESQNENGVTLTWNATSNADSSLVKSYQLFARELFGHKVGTMKRMGVVEALPLPMSCNIDKLKFNIKYKFAVCAVDLYGRFGKMSNFTGKFELKPKGPGREAERDGVDLEIIV